jgi:hypothetical protein
VYFCVVLCIDCFVTFSVLVSVYMCTVLLPSGGYLIAVKYIIYHNTSGCKYSLDAPDDERIYRSKHVEQSRNNKLSCIVASCWSLSYIK